MLYLSIAARGGELPRLRGEVLRLSTISPRGVLSISPTPWLPSGFSPARLLHVGTTLALILSPVARGSAPSRL